MKTTFTNTTRDDPASIHLSRAVLCLDCEAIYYLGSAVCPVCGSGSGALLAKWMRAMGELSR